MEFLGSLRLLCVCHQAPAEKESHWVWSGSPRLCSMEFVGVDEEGKGGRASTGACALLRPGQTALL